MILSFLASLAFNASFSLTGTTVPEPATVLLLAVGLAAAGTRLRRKLR